MNFSSYITQTVLISFKLQLNILCLLTELQDFTGECRVQLLV